MVRIAPSVLSADFSNLKDEIAKVEKGGAHLLHVDVMDGHFVPNITFGPLIVGALNRITDLPLDVHLMIENPHLYFKQFIQEGADWISIHYEGNHHLNRDIAFLKNEGVKAGVVLNPATPLSSLDYILDYVDFVLLMSVNPGFGGQGFIDNIKEKIRCLREIIDRRALQVEIEVDGGIGLDNIQQIVSCGVDIVVAGSSVFHHQDPEWVVREMIKRCRQT